MNVLVACEFSGVVRDAFRKRGHNAWSCDLEQGDGDITYHLRGDILSLPRNRIRQGLYWVEGVWDLVIAHPPCTHLSSSGAHKWKEKQADGRQQAAIDFFMEMVEFPARKVCVENPVGIMSTVFRKPDQIIHPWQFGHKEKKTTCLWLSGLKPLRHTNVVGPPPKYKDMTPEERRMWERLRFLGPSRDRGKLRSITYQGIADAMANQWG